MCVQSEPVCIREREIKFIIIVIFFYQYYTCIYAKFTFSVVFIMTSVLVAVSVTEFGNFFL